MKNNGFFKKIRKKFLDMKLLKKLVLVYAVAGVFPVLIVLVVTYKEVKSILWEKEMDSLESYGYQSSGTMDNEIDIYNNLLKYISFNQSVAQVISSQNDSDYQFYDQIISTVDPLLTSLSYFHQDINRTTIYVDKDIVTHGDTLAPMSQIMNTDFYQQTLLDNNIHWNVDEKNNTAYAVCRMSMLEQKGISGILYLEVKYDSLFKIFDNSLMNNYGVIIKDENGNVVYHKTQFEEGMEAYELWAESFEEKNVKGYQTIKLHSEITGWNIWIYKPDRLIISSMKPIEIITVVAVIVCVFAFVFGAVVVSNLITKRIHMLQSTMKKVEKGAMNTMQDDECNDEIGDLIRGFNHMVNKLDESIEELYRSKIREKEYEMTALQAQINPHFLYNSLSIINWKALEAGEEDISRLTLSLSTFYRTSLNKGKNIMTIDDEINNTKSYLIIQLIMHDNSFDTEIDVDPGILKYETLKLVLQPLIENAINHGIDLLTTRRGCIKIKGYQKDDEIFLEVLDNGIGMNKEQCEKILTAESKGYGVRNVNERIILYYGEEYRLKIESEEGVGTSAIIHFPKKI